MNSSRFPYLLLLIISLTLSSCLTTKKKFDEQKALADRYLVERNDCHDRLTKAENDLKDLSDQMKKLGKDIDDLKTSNSSLQEKNNKLKQLNEDADALNKKLQEQKEELLNRSSSEKERLSQSLAEKEKELERKSDDLKKLAAELDAKEQHAAKLSSSLKDRERRVQELESLIAKKDSAVQGLKGKLLNALSGFKDNELTVSVKDGKVYVSMSDKLLFSSGSFKVDEKGKQALTKLAEVLNKQPEISIVIEGHTDNKQYANPGGQVKNNWDLSVMRAASVSNILTEENNMDAKRIIASGRGEFFPIEPNDTPEGRSKNRRIEIILSPDLKGIFDILNSSN